MIIIPESYNYIGAFLTLSCNLNCHYCINKFGGKPQTGFMSGDDWIKGLNKIKTRSDLPITLQGGEPTTHKDFYQIVNGIDREINIDLMTNGMFDVKTFMREIRPTRISRNGPYASIRVSYHVSQHDWYQLLENVVILKNAGYSIGIWAVDYPILGHRIKVYQVKEMAERLDIDFRIKEYLGICNGKLYGEYKYPDAISSEHTSMVECKTTELLISPTGYIHRCHSDLYANRNPMAHILDDDDKINEQLDTYKDCDKYGQCNPCDIKIKTNRFQEYGHTSVDIKLNNEPTA